MKLSLSSPSMRPPVMGGSAVMAALVLLLSMTGSTRGADSCYYCANCTGSMVSGTLQDVFGVIGMTDKVDDYILGETAGQMLIDDFPACAAETSSISKMDLPDDAKGTQCMSMFFAIKDDTTVTSSASNIMLSCVVLGSVSQLFVSASNMSGDDYKAKINMLSTSGLVDDVTGLKSSNDIEDVNVGAVFCSSDNCNMLPTNDKAEIKVTVTGYDAKYEDKTSTEYMNLKAAGDRIAAKMCETMEGCEKSGFAGFEKVAATSESRQRRQSDENYNTKVLIFVETPPGSMPAESEVTAIYTTALSAAQAEGGITVLASFTTVIDIEITEGGTVDVKSGTHKLSLSLGAVLALLYLLGTRLLA